MEHNTFLPLLLITALALVVPLLADRFKGIPLPVVVGEIIAGIIIGKSGLNWVEPSGTLEFLGEFGFAFLMFLSGLEIDFNLLSARPFREESRNWQRPVPLSLIVFAGTLFMGLAFGWFLEGLGMVDNPLLMGLILSTTSLGVVVPVLKERGLLNSDFGQALLIQASLADFATLILLSVVIGLKSGGLELDLLLIPVLLLGFALFARLAHEVAAAGFLARLLRNFSIATSHIRVRGAFALMVAWVVIAEAFGVELILGAFLAGAILGLITDADTSSVREKLEAIGFGFFIPVFFILVGVNFDLPALFGSEQAVLLVPMLLGASFAVKLFPSLLLRMVFSWRQTLSAGILLSSRLSLIIAAAAIAFDIGAINTATNSAIILLALVTTTVSPLIFNQLYPEQEVPRRQGVLLVGAGPMMEFLARRLRDREERASIVCTRPSRLQAMHQTGLETTLLEGDMSQALQLAGAENARAMLDLTSSEADSLELCRLAKEHFCIPIVIARTAEVEAVPRLQHLGVRVVQPALATAMALEGALRYPTVFDVLTHATAEVEVGEVTLRNPFLLGVRVRDLHLPGNALILSLQREGTVMVPDGDSVLLEEDRIDLIGTPESIERAMAMLRG